ncbi:MAG: DNA helicase [Actinomycetales bacterium]|nr:MAG: DNA helicase [Actinomycetales bacterium]
METMAGWSRELSDVGGRNTLLWALPAAERPGNYLDLSNAHPGGVSMFLAGRVTRLSDLVREPGAFDTARDSARRICHAERMLRHERGLVTGFVAVGTATWKPLRTSTVVEAPVLLRTCTLRPTGVDEPDFEFDLGPDAMVNPALVDYLGSVVGAPVDAAALAGLADVASGFDPYPVYAALEQFCADVPGFAVTPSLVLGTYPYSKPAMVADVGTNAQWLAEVDVVAALAGDAAAAARLDTELPGVDSDPDPESELLVLGLDGAQQSVLDAVRAGQQLVLEAPLGTGRTQTLAALIAALAHDGRRILYVTPRRDSIRALEDRLAPLGLDDLLLDLTGAAENRGPVLQALGTSLRRVDELDIATVEAQAEPQGRVARATEIAQCQQVLRDHVRALHEVREPWGITAYAAQQHVQELSGHDQPPGSQVRLDPVTLQRLDHDQLVELAARIEAAAAAGAWSPEPGGDPWYGADIRDSDQIEQAREIVGRLADGALAQANQQLDAILAESWLPSARSPRDWGHAFDTMRGVRRTLEVFRPEVFDVPLDEHLIATGSATYRAGQTIRLGPVARAKVRGQARRLLRPGRPPADLHAELASAQTQRRAWYDLVGAGGRPEVSPRIDEAEEVYAALARDLHWLGQRLAGTPDLLALDLPVLRTLISRLNEQLERLFVLPEVAPVIAELRDTGLSEVIDDFAHRGVRSEQVPGELEHIWWMSLTQEIATRDPRYARHDGVALRDIASRLVRLDLESRQEDALRVRGAVDRRSMRRMEDHPGEVDLLHTQGALPRRQLPFADLFREAEHVLTALRPCLVASPYAVAQLLGPGTSFDVVIVDDASSITVAEGVSALSRGARAVIVGDPHGRRPEPFRVGSPTAPDSTAPPGQSLLEAARGLLPGRELTWWHAPMDSRLVLDVLDGRTSGIPAPVEKPRVRRVAVNGTAADVPPDGAAIEWSEAEVERTVALVVDQARHDPTASLAVLTVTETMAELVSDRIRQTLGRLGVDDPAGQALTDQSRVEPFVIVPMIRAQEVSRDIVVLAPGYGRTPDGQVPHRFPQLDHPDPEADLHRATTAARTELIVVSSLSCDDVDPSRSHTPAAVLLHRMLRFAEGRGVDPAPPTDSEPTRDPLMHELAERLRREGLVVAERVGSGEHRLDLAVGHRALPGRWLVAVEGDGPEYAGLPGVRGRDVARAEQVVRMGWQHVRVWSTDIYRDPARDVALIVDVVHALVAEFVPAQPASTSGSASDPKHDRSSSEPVSSRRPRWLRGRRSVERSQDDTDVGWGEVPDEGDRRDSWLRDQRPPHWD